MPAARKPTMIVVGDDALALSTARDICQLQDYRVVILWPAGAEFAAAVEACGAVSVAGRPDSRDGLVAAGVADAVSILALARDEELNLQTALRARDANPRIRIVLRQFNRTLAAKIEQNLPDCSVLSLAWHSAATYAAAALDPSCFRGLQFPEPDGPLTGFARRTASADDIAGYTVAEAEVALGARVVALDGDTVIVADARIAAGARLVVYGPVEQLLGSAPRQTAPERRRRLAARLRALRRGGWRPHRIDRYIVAFTAATVGLFSFATWHFHESLGGDWLTAAYFVTSTITTTGYGDITPHHEDVFDVAVAMALMLLGTVFTGIFIAIAAARLIRAQWVRTQGLRPIHRRGHIVVCGSGSIGTGVIDLLLGFDKPLVVVERNPDPALVERARADRFDLLTGDASRDDTLDLCNLDAAHSLLALTNIDSLNLEIGLGARARNPSMPVVLRIAEAEFAASIARHFQFDTTFSVAALAGPAFAGLSRLPGARGRVAWGGKEFALVELVLAGEMPGELRRHGIPLAAEIDGTFAFIRDFDGLTPGTRALVLVPLAPFQGGEASIADITERVIGLGGDSAQTASSHQIGV